MSTTNKWLIGIGVVLLLAAMYFLPFALQSTAPAYGGYGMMGGGMMGGGRGGMMGGGMHGGMMGYSGFGYGLMWVIPLALLVLIGLGIAALVKYLRTA